MLALLNTLFAYAINGRTTYQARIIKPDGYPLQASGVNFRFTVLDQSGSCVLYVEDYAAINMTDTSGLISFPLGTGARSFPTSGTAQTFQNTFDNSITSFACQTMGIYNPNPTDTRKIVMQFNDGNGWQTLPAMSINAVPYAMFATRADNSRALNGKADTAFVEYSALNGLGCAADQAIKYNGVSFSCITVGSSSTPVTSSTVIAALGYTPAQGTSFTSLDSTVNSVSSAVYSVSSTVSGLTSSVTSLSNSVTASFAAITSSQWSASGTSIYYNVGNVGLGTSAPITKLDVAGGIRISMEAATCATSFAGTLRYNAGSVEYCNGAAWLPFGVAGSGITSLNSSTSGTQTFATGITGTVFNISSANGVHTFNIPLAASGSVTAGLLSNADYVTFTNKVSATSAAVISALGYTPASATGLGALAALNFLDLSSSLASGTLSVANLPSVGSGVTSGAQYTKVTVDGKGRVISGSQLILSDVTTALGYTPANSATVVSSQWNTSGTTINYVAGHVGIGTATPGSRLTIKGAGTTNATSSLNVTNSSNSSLLYVGDNGNVGVGDASPFYKLTVNGSFNSTSANISNIVLIDANGINIGSGAPPSYPLAIDKNRGSNETVNITQISDDANGAWIKARKRRSTSPFNPQSGDELLTLGAEGMAGGTWSGESARIGMMAAENFSASGKGAYISFETTAVSSTSRLERMRIDSNGQVGIGVTAPTAKFHLAAGTSSVAPLKFTSGTLLTSPQSGTMEYDGVNFYVTDGSNQRRTIATGSSTGSIDNASTINSSGNITLTPTGSVVVSSTTASTSSSNGALVVKGGAGIAGDLNVAGIVSSSSQVKATGFRANQGVPNSNDSSTNGYSFGLDGDTGLFSPGSGGANGIVSIFTNNVEMMRVNQTGVGIGTSNPGALFQVGENTASGAAFRFASSADQSAVRFATNASANWIQSGVDFTGDSKKDLKFSSINAITTWMTIQASSGNVGIGTTTPAYKLSVYEPSGNVVQNVESGNNGSTAYTRHSGKTAGGVTHTYGNGLNISDGNGGYEIYDFTAGVSRMFINTAGNIGVNTTNPGAKLHILGGQALENSSANTAGASIAFWKNRNYGATLNGDELGYLSFYGHDGSTSRRSAYIISHADGAPTSGSVPGSLKFFTTTSGSADSTEKMRIGANGNVGIGTSNPTTALDVNGFITTGIGTTQIGGVLGSNRGIVPNSGLIVAGNTGSSNGGYAQFYGTNAVSGTDDRRGSVDIGSYTAGGAPGNINFYNYNGSGWLSRMMVNGSTGNIGMGTTSPGFNLHVQNRLGQGGNVAVTNNDFVSGSAGSGIYMGTSVASGNTYSQVQAFTTGNTVAGILALNPFGGNVGVGTSTPASKFEVRGGNTFMEGRAYVYSNSGWGAVTPSISLAIGDNDTGINWVSDGVLQIYGNNAVRMHFALDGNNGIGTTTPSYKLDVNGTIRGFGITDSSDIRLKKNVMPLDLSLEKILQIEGVSYNWIDKDRSEKKQIGFIAQQLEAIYPELVETDKQGMKSVNYSHLVAPLVEAFKTLYQKVTGVEREIASLKAENEELKTKVKEFDELKAYICKKDPEAPNCKPAQ